MNIRQKILSVDELEQVRGTLREDGKVVVQCHGCFDIVHPGHIRYLRFAREQGDVLIVSVSGDEVVGKGFDRPYITEDLRMENLAALEFVDYVCVDYHNWAGPVLQQLKPDIYIKGKEYETSRDSRFLREKKLVEEYGGQVIFSSGDVVYSSSFIIQEHSNRFALQNEKIRFYCRRHGINMEHLESMFRDVVGKRVLIVGDAILDQYIFCDAASVASEGPILSVAPVDESWFVGGAGLIAKQLSYLGAETTFMSVLTPNHHSERLMRDMDRAGCQVENIHVDNRPVHVKARYLVQQSKVFKVDHGLQRPLSTQVQDQLLQRIEVLLADYDAFVAIDFGYGLFGSVLAEKMSELSARIGKPYYIDVSALGSSSFLRFRQPHLATPTESELRFAFGDKDSGLSHLAVQYYEETQAKGLVITMGDKGVLMFYPPEEGEERLKTEYLPAFEQVALDPVGAGDVFLSGMLLADVAGAPRTTGLYLGSCLSGLHIRHLGNQPADLHDLQRYLERREELS
ncbi:MAG TPA: hypothetical protein DCE42_05155 [Myxococcales bacterium]|nr:hypothetical protein [Deltaproteobacteria bacterium]MBU54175.1 hypothetical protein [Deltaproteobacteria bacterium]HAA54119.1 hypothetical protein [Myxococcales bacterium]|tara:strand:- start:2808 stop:4346 length:1539 start_codon:yes stop_codon:yes gene_type:complete